MNFVGGMRMWGIVALCVTSWLLMVISGTEGALSTVSRTGIKICLKNCGQCKRMYGDYFEGRRCGDYCLFQKGRFIPDCHDLYSIGDFISKLE